MLFALVPTLSCCMMFFAFVVYCIHVLTIMDLFQTVVAKGMMMGQESKARDRRRKDGTKEKQTSPGRNRSHQAQVLPVFDSTGILITNKFI